MVAQPLLPHPVDSLTQVVDLFAQETKLSPTATNGELQSKANLNTSEQALDSPELSASHLISSQTKYVGTDVYQEDLLDSGSLLSEEDGQFWKSYLKEAKAFDKQLLGMWRESVDAVTAQAGLFSIVAALFVTASIAFPISASTNTGLPIEINPSLPPLFIGSLSLCIIATLGGSLVKQWLHSYTQIQILPNTWRAQGRARQRWLRVAKSTKLDSIVLQIIPGLLEASTLLFLVDLIAFGRRLGLGGVVTGLLNTAWLALIIGYLVIATLGVCSKDMPFQSGLASLLKALWSLVVQSGMLELEVMREGGGRTPTLQKTTKTVIQHVQIIRPLTAEASAAALIDAEAVTWLLKHSKDDKATALAIHAIPLLPSTVISSVMMAPSEEIFGVGRLIARLRSHLRPGKPLGKEEMHAVVGVGRALYHVLAAVPRSVSSQNEAALQALEDAGRMLEPLLHLIADSELVEFVVLARCLHLSITTTTDTDTLHPDIEQLDTCLTGSAQMSKWALLMLLDSAARFPAFYGAGPGSVKTITRKDFNSLARVMAVAPGHAPLPSVSVISATVLTACVALGLHDEAIKKGLPVRHDGLVGNILALLRWQEVSDIDATLPLHEVLLRVIKDLIVQHRHQAWFISAYPFIASSALSILQKTPYNSGITKAALLLLSELPEDVLLQEMKESDSINQENVWNVLINHNITDPEMKSALQVGGMMLLSREIKEDGYEAHAPFAEGIPPLLVSALHSQNPDLARVVYLGSPQYPSPWFTRLEESLHQEFSHLGLGDAILHCICYAGPHDVYSLFQLSDHLLQSNPAIWSPEFVAKGFLGNAVNEVILADAKTAEGKLTLLYASKFYVHLWKSQHDQALHWDEEVFPTGRGLQAASKIAKHLHHFAAKNGIIDRSMVLGMEDWENWAVFAESFQGTRWSNGLLASEFIKRFIGSLSIVAGNGSSSDQENKGREEVVLRMRRLEESLRD